MGLDFRVYMRFTCGWASRISVARVRIVFHGSFGGFMRL